MRATPRSCFAPSAARGTCFAPRDLTAMSSPLRVRLTLWYVGTFSVVLVLFSAAVYFFVERILVDRLDTNLRVTLQTTRAALDRDQAKLNLDAFEDPRFPGQIVALVDGDGHVFARKPIRPALIFRLPAVPLHPSPSPQVHEFSEP